MNWPVIFLPYAQKDFDSLSGDQRILAAKALDKVRKNPLPFNEGGLGKPLGNKGGSNLSGFLKIKLKSAGLRVVYKLIRTETTMLIIVIGARADDDVYKTARTRAKNMIFSLYGNYTCSCQYINSGCPAIWQRVRSMSAAGLR